MSMYCLKDDKTSSDILKKCFTKTDIDSEDDKRFKKLMNSINFLESDNIIVSTMVNLVSMQNYGELHDKNFNISMEFNFYDMQFSKFKVVYKGAQIYYRDRVFFSIDTLFLYAFCNWLFHLFLVDLDANNRTKIKETLDD
nr:MAG TPA: hypothetical protein [Caudoviricetes sp.]